MKARDLVSLLSMLDPDIEISLPCGRNEAGETLYTEVIIPQEMHAPEAAGIDPDGTPQMTNIPMIMLLPGEGPWAKDLKVGEETDEEGDGRA